MMIMLQGLYTASNYNRLNQCLLLLVLVCVINIIHGDAIYYLLVYER